MRRLRFVFVLAMAVVVATGTLAACGAAATPTATQLSAAESNAVDACGQMLGLGNDVVTDGTLTTASAKETLARAQGFADDAAKVDPGQWKGLDADISHIRVSLETNHRVGLKADLTQLGTLCAPLAVNGN